MTVSRLDIAVDKTGLSYPAGGTIAVLRARADTDYSAFSRTNLELFNSFRPEHDRLTGLGHATPDAVGQGYDLALVHVTRSKAETLGLIGLALERTKTNGTIVVDGARTDGIDSVLKQINSVLPLAGKIAKYHGRLFWLTRPKTLPETVVTWRENLDLGVNPDGFHTAPGMFSSNHIDAGSRLLASHFDNRINGLVADLGAGWGWLSARALALGQPEHIDLFEAELRALDAARINLADAPAGFYWADVPTLSNAARYDIAITNPPFHQGREATPSLGLAFIAKAAAILKPSGSLWLVANRQLPYEASLDQYFGRWQILEETGQFKVVLASRPLAGSGRKRTVKRSRPR